MANTIGEQPWEYTSLLNECIKIVLTIVLGMIMARFKIFDTAAFVSQAVKFVFRVALPLHIMRGIGIVVDFYDQTFSWVYIAAFLILRVIALVVCFGWVISASTWGSNKNQGIGQVAVLWLTLTWISTVILGVPISKATFGSDEKGLFYGLLAGISSFIFQLPLQLLFLECHALEREYLNARTNQSAPSDIETPEDTEVPSGHLELGDTVTSSAVTEQVQNGEPLETSIAKCAVPLEQEMAEDVSLFRLWLTFARRRDIWKKIAIKVLSNPVIWGIAAGFFLSLTTIGPRYLKPTSPDYVPGLGWFFALASWFGDMVSPLSLFAMGVWMQNQGRKLFCIPWYDAVLSMFSKLVIVPLIMVGLAKGLGLNNEAARAAVLIAALPISMASFTFGSIYKVGEALLSENVALGTILMLPTIIIWNVVMDKIGLFPIPATSA